MNEPGVMTFQLEWDDVEGTSMPMITHPKFEFEVSVEPNNVSFSYPGGDVFLSMKMSEFIQLSAVIGIAQTMMLDNVRGELDHQGCNGDCHC